MVFDNHAEDEVAQFHAKVPSTYVSLCRDNNFQYSANLPNASQRRTAQLKPQALDQAYQPDDIFVQPNGAAGTVSLIVKNYPKPSDSITLVFSQQQKALKTVQVASYLTTTSDAITIAVQFAESYQPVG